MTGGTEPSLAKFHILRIKNCFECHLSGAKESGFVFHTYTE